MSNELKFEQLTLYGGDVTRFMREQGPRLFEAIFRIEHGDPIDYETRRIAKAELDALNEESRECYGMSPEEFYVIAKTVDNRTRAVDGSLFIDTEEGHRTYFGAVNTAALFFELPIK